MRYTSISLAMFCSLFFVAPVVSQVSTQPVKVYIDCQTRRCDSSYFQEEVPWVGHVRARQDADIHVMVSSQSTASGGREYVLSFIPQAKPQEKRVLRYVSAPAQAEASVRDELLNLIKLGLVQHALDTSSGRNLQVTYLGKEEPEVASNEDPWNKWTFNTYVSTQLNGEESYKERELFAALSASRVTEEWKIRTRLSANDHTQAFKFVLDGEEREVETVNRSLSAGGFVAKSVGEHVAVGAMGNAFSSTFLNRDLSFRFAPAVEYNFWPYSESSERQLIVNYSVGPEWEDYKETTIFGKDTELLVKQSLQSSLVLKQPWGSANVYGEAASFLHDWSQNRLRGGLGLEMNLVKGLSLEIDGNAERVRDQLHLSGVELSPEEILLRQRQLATGFRYFFRVGLSYTFGSSVADIVNTRLGRFEND